MARETKPNLTCCDQLGWLAVCIKLSNCDFTLTLSLSLCLWQISDFTTSDCDWCCPCGLHPTPAYHGNQISSRFFKVTFWSTWRSLSPSKKVTSGSQKSLPLSSKSWRMKPLAAEAFVSLKMASTAASNSFQLGSTSHWKAWCHLLHCWHWILEVCLLCMSCTGLQKELCEFASVRTVLPVATSPRMPPHKVSSPYAVSIFNFNSLNNAKERECFETNAYLEASAKLSFRMDMHACFSYAVRWPTYLWLPKSLPALCLLNDVIKLQILHFHLGLLFSMEKAQENSLSPCPWNLDVFWHHAALAPAAAVTGKTKRARVWEL